MTLRVPKLRNCLEMYTCPSQCPICACPVYKLGHSMYTRATAWALLVHYTGTAWILLVHYTGTTLTEQHDSVSLYFLESLPTVADDIVCDPPPYSTGSGDQSWAYKSLLTCRLLERIQGNWGKRSEPHTCR